MDVITLWLFNIAMEAMAHYRWFSQLDTSIYKGFSMAMLNNQRVFRLVMSSIISGELTNDVSTI
jgi:hypothetical protein